MPWFLATAPLPGGDMVARTTVCGLLDRGVASHRATVVSAPSGFGKTVAVSQWALAHQLATPGSVSWLTLTDQVSGISDVLGGVLTALQSAACDRKDAALHRALTAVFETTSYPAAFAQASAIDHPQPVTLVIDDFQNARDILDQPYFSNFVEHCPNWLRLILITTDAVDPPLARLRTHDLVAVIGSNELALTAAQIGQLAVLMGRPVTAGRAEAIHADTKGWPGVVRLGLVAGPESPSCTTDADLTEYIRSAVLARMRPALADFVLSTTVSTRLDERLACTLAGRPDGTQLLGECLPAGLFIERFTSDETTVYQWHSMFVAHCRTILRRSDAKRWRHLNRLAARELKQRYPLQAVEHAIHADDAQLAVQIIVDHWLELLLQSRSEALDATCVTAIMAFGENAEVLMIRACCRGLAGDTIGTGLLLARAKALSPAGILPPQLAFITDLTEILLSDDQDAIAAAADRTQSALSDRSVTAPRVYACALYVLGWANCRLRRGARGTALLEAAVHECRAMGLAELAERARQNLGFAAAAVGEFDRALQLLGEVANCETVPELWLAHDGGGIERFAVGYVRFWRGGYLAPTATACRWRATG